MGLLKLVLTWWNDATLGTLIMTWWRGELVGSDAFGNRYYRARNRDRRWVIYNGDVEASRVPPEWHAWLHRMVERPPSEQPLKEQPWEKAHVPNLTGTAAAYLPPGHLEVGGRRAKATGDYEAWRPE